MDRTLNGFVWCELITTDLDAAQAFYGDVVGWRADHAGMEGSDYTIISSGDIPVGGMMTLPPEACEAGVPTMWMGYVKVDDVDRAAERIAAQGGTIYRAPDDIPGIGRFAVAADPQGAVFTLFAWASPEPPAAAPNAPGQNGWRELRTSDPAAACDFYAAMFGWEKGEAFDMGPDGKYQLVGLNGTMFGGVSPMETGMVQPHWFYYFNVEDIDDARRKVEVGGGGITLEPVEVPGSAWIIHCTDPQGAAFGLVGPRQ